MITVSRNLVVRFTVALLVLLITCPAPLAEARKLPSRVASNHGKGSISARVGTARGSKRPHKCKRKISIQKLQQEIGALVVSESGETVMDKLSNVEFNPASVAKIVTAYGALKAFGPSHQFQTKVFIEGSLDSNNSALNGNLYIQGCDPDFERKDALEVGQMLVDQGIKTINGKILVSKDFSYGSASDAGWSGHALLRVWSKKGLRIVAKKGVGIATAPESAIPFGQFNSETLKDTLKEMLSYSQNSVAEQIGRVVGGVKRLEEIVVQESNLKPGAIKLASASGLGRSRVSPSNMMIVLKSLRSSLRKEGLDFQDIFPVAGIDPGTLDERFTDPTERGSVVGKTGTLPGTDGGTSTLVGMFRSQKEDLYFVIFCWKGNVVSFRHQQDELIRQLQSARGGPKAFEYKNLPQQPAADGV